MPAGGCPWARTILVRRYRAAGTAPPHGPREKRGGLGLATEEGLVTLPWAQTAHRKGTGAHREGDKDGGSYLDPAGRAGDGPATARRGLKSPAPPAPPSVRRAHWWLPAPPALPPAPLIGPFESGRHSACSPRAPEAAAPPRERAPRSGGTEPCPSALGRRRDRGDGAGGDSAAGAAPGESRWS